MLIDENRGRFTMFVKGNTGFWKEPIERFTNQESCTWQASLCGDKLEDIFTVRVHAISKQSMYTSKHKQWKAAHTNTYIFLASALELLYLFKHLLRPTMIFINSTHIQFQTFFICVMSQVLMLCCLTAFHCFICIYVHIMC